ALAGLLGMAERGLDRDHGIEAGEDIGDRNARLLRLAAGLSGDGHHSGHALDDEVVAGPRGVRTRLAEAGYRAVDEAGVDPAQALVIEPVFLQPAQLEVLDQHVGGRRQLANRLGALWRREVERDRALSAIGRVVVGGREVFAVLAGHERRAPFAGVIAAVGVLDL